MKNNPIGQLADYQNPDGSFKINDMPVLMGTAKILQNLCLADSKEIQPIKEKASVFLLSLLNDDGTFGNSVYGTQKLTQSFEAWAALCLFDQALLTGDYLGKIMKLLTSIEVEPGGPYRCESEIDLHLNYAIANFLKTQNVELDSLTALLKSYESNKPDTQASALVERINEVSMDEQLEVAESISFNRQITDEAIHAFTLLEGSLGKESLRLLNALMEGDTEGKITLLAYNFYKGLDWKKSPIDPEKNKKLGLTNLYLWLAYTIYDNFLDLDGTPNQLSTANYCLRNCTAIVYKDFSSHRITGLYKNLMDEMDSMNAWEIEHCRNASNLPDFRNSLSVASKSIPHAFGPLAILHLLQLPDEEINKTERFFRHYLAARQLDDDAHDWLEDLGSGQITYVVAKILEKFDKPLTDLNTSKSELQKVFTFDILPAVSKEILSHTEEAVSILTQCAYVKKPAYLLSLLEPHRRSATKALNGISKTEQLISSWIQ